MFWKRFKQTRSANRLFNDAADHWHRQQYLLASDDIQAARKARLEVVRLCQLAIQADKHLGDAYVLLANALSVSALDVLSADSAAVLRYIRGPKLPAEQVSRPNRYESLLSRAAAVIHFWYSLPYRGYPATKNGAQAERLWGMIADEVRRYMGLDDDSTMTLLDSYRDSLAVETVSPTSFPDIEKLITGTG